MIQFKTDKIKERISSTKTFDPQAHMAHINRAYRNHIEKFFPEDTLEELEDTLSAPSGDEAKADQTIKRKKQEKLISLFYDALANLGYFYSIPHLEVTVTSTGIVSIKSAEREKADPRQIIRLEKSFSESGLENLDRMLKYLKKESVLFSWFPAVYQASGFEDLLVSDADIFQTAVDINGSMLIYTQLRPVIKHTENLELRSFIGKEHYQAILSPLASDHSLYPLQKNAISFVALRAMATGLRMKDVGMNEKGIYQIFIENRDYGKHPAALPSVNEKINLLNQLAAQYKEQIEEIINPSEDTDGVSDVNREDSGLFHTWG